MISHAEPLKLAGTDLRPVVIDPVTDERWDRFVEGHPHRLVFHTSAWARVLTETYGYGPRYHALEDKTGALRAGWPAMLVKSRITGRRLVSLPFCDECHPLVRSTEEGELLLSSLIADVEQSRSARLEVRGWPEDSSPPERLVASPNYYRHRIDLSSGSDAVFKNASTNMRRSVRRAEREGVTVRRGDGEGDLMAFYQLNLKVRRRHGMLPQPFSFFQAIERHLLSRGTGYILLAEIRGMPIAGVMCLRHNGTSIDKFAVSDDAYWEYRGNHLALWKSLEMECERGAHAFDLGRSDANADGLRRFKEGWGAKPSDLPYFYYPRPAGLSLGDPSGRKKQLLEIFAERAPDAAFVAAGRILYRHLG
jgi:CelD/BcsL family acetyltransferase involved in cellulose biosynthesis